MASSGLGQVNRSSQVRGVLLVLLFNSGMLLESQQQRTGNAFESAVEILVPHDESGTVNLAQVAEEGVTVEVWGLLPGVWQQAILQIDGEEVATSFFSPKDPEAVITFPVPFPSCCGKTPMAFIVKAFETVHISFTAEFHCSPCAEDGSGVVVPDNGEIQHLMNYAAPPVCLVLQEEELGWASSNVAVVWEFVGGRAIKGSGPGHEIVYLLTDSETIWNAAREVFEDRIVGFPKHVSLNSATSSDNRGTGEELGWKLPAGMDWTAETAKQVQNSCGSVVASSAALDLILNLVELGVHTWVLGEGALLPAPTFVGESRDEAGGSPLVSVWDVPSGGCSGASVMERIGMQGRAGTYALVWEEVARGMLVDEMVVGEGLEVLRMNDVLLPDESIADCRSLLEGAAEIHLGGVDRALMDAIQRVAGDEAVRCVHSWGGNDEEEVREEMPWGARGWEVHVMLGLESLGFELRWPRDGGVCVQSKERPACEVMVAVNPGVVLGGRAELVVRVDSRETLRGALSGSPRRRLADPGFCYEFGGNALRMTSEGGDACLIVQTMDAAPLEEGRHWVEVELVGPWPRSLQRSLVFDVVESVSPYAQPYFLSLVAVFKDEDRYLREWIEFHLCAGVDHFFLFNHASSSDLHRHLLQPYIDRGVVDLDQAKESVVDGNGNMLYSGQLVTYTHAVRKHANDTVWVACLDLDEFLFAEGPFTAFDRSGRRRHIQHPSLRDVLEGGGYERFGGVVAHWVHFGSGGMVHPARGLTIDAFLWRERGVDDHFKVVARASRVQFCNNHNHDYAPGYIAVDEQFHLIGNNQSSNHHRPANVLRLNHYRLKSLEEIAGRMRRDLAANSFARERHDWADFTAGSTALPATRLRQYFDQRHFNQARDPSTAERFSACVREGLVGTGLPEWVRLVEFEEAFAARGQVEYGEQSGGGLAVPLLLRAGGSGEVRAGVWVDGALAAAERVVVEEGDPDALAEGRRFVVRIAALSRGVYEVAAGIIEVSGGAADLVAPTAGDDAAANELNSAQSAQGAGPSGVKAWVRELVAEEWLAEWAASQPASPGGPGTMPPGAALLRLRVV